MSKKNNTVNNEIKNDIVKEKKKATPWKIATVTLAAALITVSCTWAFTANMNKSASSNADASVTETVSDTENQNTEADALSLWTETAPLKSELTAYVKAVSRYLIWTARSAARPTPATSTTSCSIIV